MRKLFGFAVAVVLVLAVGFCGCDDAKVPDRSIRLVTGEQEYAPSVMNGVFSLQNNVVGDSAWKKPQDVIDELEAVSIDGDIRIVLEGDVLGKQLYTLYDEEYEVLYQENEFTEPQEPGKYVLCVLVTWGTEKAHSGYQYFFLLEK